MSAPRSNEEVVPASATASTTGSHGLHENWDYTIGIRIFQSGGVPAQLTRLPKLADVEDLDRVPGHVFQAARNLAGLSQQELRDASMVSKKMINDFENNFRRPSAMLVEKLASTLRDHGARFVEADGLVGVVAVSTRSDVHGGSRSPRRRAAEA